MTQNPEIDAIRSKRGYLCDMDGVIYHGDHILDGAWDFVTWLEETGKSYLFLTNASRHTPLDLKEKMARMGLEIDESKFYTSALATARFLQSQAPGCSAYVIGDAGLVSALLDVGISIIDVGPDYVVVGETRNYDYDKITKAIAFVRNGAKLIGAHPDMTSPSENGLIPACRALIAPIELAAERSAYYIGKPNALMMRTGLSMLGVHSSEAVMIGDRMDTDIIAGIETGLETVLVLSGVTSRELVETFPYRPKHILNNVGEIVAPGLYLARASIAAKRLSDPEFGSISVPEPKNQAPKANAPI